MKNFLRNSMHSYCRTVYPFVALLLLLIITGWAYAGDVKVSAQLNSDSFPVDEAVLLTVTVQGASSAIPPSPTGTDLQFTYRGQSSQMQWINGKTSATISFSYMVQANKPGDYTIEPVKVVVEGHKYFSNPLSCTVLPASASRGASASASPRGSQGASSGPSTRLRSGDADKIGFMRISPEHETLYPGQLTHFTVKAHFRRGLRVTLNSNPSLLGNNFILHSLDEKPVQQEELINGERYITLTWHGTLSAVKEGQFPLEFELDASLLMRVNRQRSRDPFGSLFGNDPFFDDFFGRYSKREVKLASPKKSITVQPLPTTDRPADFKGAIGSYSLAVAASPLQGRVGDPITLKMIISGSGNFDLVQPPELTETKHWKTYPPTHTYDEETPGQGQKRFEQAIVPTSPDITEIGAIQFSYFDPELKKYVSLHSDPLPIQLEQQTSGSSSPKSLPAADLQPTSSPNRVSDNNLAPLHTKLGKLVKKITPLYQKNWFIALIAAAFLIMLSAFYFSLRRKLREKNPQLILRKNLEQALLHHFKTMQEAIDSSDQKTFISHCRQAIQEYLALQWGVNAQSITRADLQQRLGDDALLQKIFAQLDQAGFSGSTLDRQSMTKLMRDTQKGVRSS